MALVINLMNEPFRTEVKSTDDEAYSPGSSVLPRGH